MTLNMWTMYITSCKLFLFKLFTCERVLEQEGVLGDVSLDELPLDLIPLDKDVLSLELPEFFRCLYLVCNTTENVRKCKENTSR